MYCEIIGESLCFHLQNTALLKFNGDHKYENIISPFSRLYLVTEGNGYLVIGHNKIILEPGYLYLIPSFTFCSYHFGTGLSHYYIHFSIDHPNGMSPFSLFSYINKTKASELDYKLFERIIQINPDLKLPHHHPNVYQTKLWLNKKVEFQSPNHHIETIGILKQIFSRFLVQGQNQTITGILKYNIQPILAYIQNNLKREIKIEELANLACFSKDHFSKVFKLITGLAPSDFIIKKRIERAQFLLLTTDLGMKEVIEECGFKSSSYFSRAFKNYTLYTPAKYRLQRG